ncbi:MAG: hypothetical protein U9N34_10725 [Candidatus Cloacimonadota bacterium]|nr:hypothetical protein [Candidatus Cloacimonadota bacterium]
MISEIIYYFQTNASFLGIVILTILILSSFGFYVSAFIENDINKKETTIELDIEEDEEEIEEVVDNVDSV